jgi:hypothetical protein
MLSRDTILTASMFEDPGAKTLSSLCGGVPYHGIEDRVSTRSGYSVTSLGWGNKYSPAENPKR